MVNIGEKCWRNYENKNFYWLCFHFHYDKGMHESVDLVNFDIISFKGGDEEARPLKIPGVYFRRFLPLSNKVRRTH